MTDGLAHRDQLAVEQIEPLLHPVRGESRRDQVAEDLRERLQSGDPPPVGSKTRNGFSATAGDQKVSVFQSGQIQARLEEGKGDHFGVGEGGRRIVGPPSVSEPRMSLQEVVRKDVQFH